MKLISLILVLPIASGFAQSSAFVNFVRQTQQGTGVIWDMPVASSGTASAALPLDSTGAVFQLWAIDKVKVKDHLLDQKLVGAYMPTADVKVITLDTGGNSPRTRVDKPFSVEINVGGLLTEAGFPIAASKVLIEQHIESYPSDQTLLDPAVVMANTPLYSGYISANGRTVLKFPASSLKAPDPTQARGEEYFVVHALSDDTVSQSQISSACVQVWPVASGEIKGIKNGDLVRFQVPKIELILNDLYPRSDTSLMLFEGSTVNGVTGVVVKAYPVDRSTTVSTVISVTELDSKFKNEGTYTLALVSETVYGTELLCPPVTFEVSRTIRVNAMQVNYSDGNTP
jgi:hypothetical protein